MRFWFPRKESWGQLPTALYHKWKLQTQNKKVKDITTYLKPKTQSTPVWAGVPNWAVGIKIPGENKCYRIFTKKKSKLFFDQSPVGQHTLKRYNLKAVGAVKLIPKSLYSADIFRSIAVAEWFTFEEVNVSKPPPRLVLSHWIKV